MTLNPAPLGEFDYEGDACSVGLRWKKWRRAFNIYLEASNIEGASKKRAILLHTRGLGLQEIFYNTPGANVGTNSELDVYEIAIKKLVEYFLPNIARSMKGMFFEISSRKKVRNSRNF